MNTRIDLQTTSEIHRSIADYMSNLYIIAFQSGSQDLTDLISKNGRRHGPNMEREWSDPDIYTIVQNWSNTSAGWEGIGGSAMTASYTTIIENTRIGFSCVYYRGQLAYIVEIDEKYQDLVTSKYGRRRMPGYKSVDNVLTVLWKKKF